MCQTVTLDVADVPSVTLRKDALCSITLLRARSLRLRASLHVPQKKHGYSWSSVFGGLCYVGKTKRALKTRTAEHMSNIRTLDQRNPVAAHFTEARHNISSLKYIGIEHVKTPRRDTDNLLLRRDLDWIHRACTMSPRGLNQQFDMRPFLTWICHFDLSCLLSWFHLSPESGRDRPRGINDTQVCPIYSLWFPC